jgi:hypothetical protein
MSYTSIEAIPSIVNALRTQFNTGKPLIKLTYITCN